MVLGASDLHPYEQPCSQTEERMLHVRHKRIGSWEDVLQRWRICFGGSFLIPVSSMGNAESQNPRFWGGLGIVALPRKKAAWEADPLVWMNWGGISCGVLNVDPVLCTRTPSFKQPWKACTHPCVIGKVRHNLWFRVFGRFHPISHILHRIRSIPGTYLAQEWLVLAH